MLSFLIPTYDYDCTVLVRSLFEQASAFKAAHDGEFDFEILVADDASPDRRKLDGYHRLSQGGICSFFPLEHNLGRARIRNFLAGKARFDHVVFIDCDAEVCTDDFVVRYWRAAGQGDVVCGSLRNPAVCPPGGELRYRYEKAAEAQRTVEFRRMRPYAYFTTFNVMFSRKVFEVLQFDERCVDYGYEDALMGVMLEKSGYTVAHIDNPLIHNGIDKNAVYMDKVEASLRVLYQLGEPLHSASALVRLEHRLRRQHLLSALRGIYALFGRRWRARLLGHHPSMALLKLYKLGYYAAWEQQQLRR